MGCSALASTQRDGDGGNAGSTNGFNEMEICGEFRGPVLIRGRLKNCRERY